jgi:uncharacterized protein
MSDPALLSFFITGLLAGTHCAGMCGGIVAAASCSRSANTPASLIHVLAFNLGRVSSYALAGAIVGGLGAAAVFLGPQQPMQAALYSLANAMLIALGLYFTGITRLIAGLERMGQPIWRRLAPLTRNLLPVRRPAQALALGGLWGWLPCGLVYSVLAAAFASGHPAQGALTMLAFGIGTLPNLVALSLVADKIRPLLQRKALRIVAGLIIIGFGILGFMRNSELGVAYALSLLCHTPAR